MPNVRCLTRFLPALLVSLLPLIPTARADWPQFRGSRASGVDDRAPIPTTWNLETGQGVKWQTPIPGLAHASPVTWGDRVYIATAVKPGNAELKVGLYGDIESVDEKEPHQWRLLSLDLGTGRVVWNVLAYEGIPRIPRHPKSSHCNSTPATDGRHIVALFGTEGLCCFDRDGRALWKKELGPLDSGYFAVPSAQWGFASSPVIHNGRVIVLADVQTNSFLAAFDLADGHEVWRTDRTDVPTWGTPAVVDAAGHPQIAVNGWHVTAGYELATGRELWRLDGGGDIPVPTPIFAHGLMYFTSAHGKLRPMRAIRPDARGNITPPDPGATNAAIVWAHPRQGNYMQTPIVVGDLLWGCTDWGIVTCFDARTGAIRYSERIGSGNQGFTASPVSDGRHLFFTSEVGQVFVVPATDRFSLIATNKLGETCMASPALAQGTALFRTRTQVVAIGGAALGR